MLVVEPEPGRDREWEWIGKGQRPRWIVDSEYKKRFLADLVGVFFGISCS